MANLRLLLAAALPSVAHAGPLENLDLSFAIGDHEFARDSELGSDSMNGPGPRDGAVLGARAAYSFIPAVAAELELVAIPTKDDVLGESVNVFGFRAHARVDVLELARLRPNKLRVFALAGVGAHTIGGGAPQLQDDTDACYQWGGAFTYAFTDRIGLRLDVRHLIVPDRREDGATNELEVSAGIAIRFAGRTSVPPPMAPRRVAMPAPPAPAAPRVEPPGVMLAALPPIEFDARQSAVRSASRPILDRVAEILRQHPAVRIEIAGHTSADGAEAANLDLSIDRAREVARYLSSRGVAAERMTVVGHGAGRPLAGDDTEATRARNRRAEIRIVGGN